MSKKKAIKLGLKATQNPSVFAGVAGVFLDCIFAVSVIMLILSPLFIWMYGFDLIQGLMIIIYIIIICFYIFDNPSKSKSKRIINPETQIRYAKMLEDKESSKKKKNDRAKKKNNHVRNKYIRCPECNSLVNTTYDSICRYCGCVTYKTLPPELPTNTDTYTPAQIRIKFDSINQQFISEGKIVSVEEIMKRAGVKYIIIEKNKLYKIID